MLQKTNFSRVNFSLWVLLRHFTVLTLFQIGLMMTQSKMGVRLHLFWAPELLLFMTPEHMTRRLPDVTRLYLSWHYYGYLRERLNFEKLTRANFRLMKRLLINSPEQTRLTQIFKVSSVFRQNDGIYSPGLWPHYSCLMEERIFNFTFSFDILNPYCLCHYHPGISVFSKLSNVKQAWKPEQHMVADHPHIQHTIHSFWKHEWIT